jgi:hypothetical protein
VTWDSDEGTGGTIRDIYGRIVNGDGSLGAVHWITDSSGLKIESDVDCSRGGNRFLVTFSEIYTNSHYGITARAVNPDLSMDPVIRLVQPGGEVDRRYSAVVSGSTNFLVAWEHERYGVAYQDIHARLVSLQALFLPLIRR